MIRFILLLTLLVAGKASGQTQWTPPEEIRKGAPQNSERQQQKPVAAYGDDHPDCREWTDGCIVCKRQEASDPACSMPGVACLPAEPACVTNVSDRKNNVSDQSNR